MAKIRVYADEADGDEFPRLCVRCGADAGADSKQKFSWHPPWVLLLVLLHILLYVIVAVVLRKSMTVTLPVCRRHRNHWLNRKLYVWLGLLFWVAAGTAAALTFKDLPKDAGPYVIGGFVFGGLGWLIVGVVLANKAVRPKEITDRYIELVNVDREFADAWEEDHPMPKPKPRRRPVRRYDDEDDRYDDGPPRGRRADDRYDDGYDRG